jgi:hypothetical protein
MSRNRKLTLGIFAICLILVMAVSTFLIVNPAGEELPGVTEQIAFQSYVVVDVYRPVGGEMVLIYHQESHNVITNVGLWVIARELTTQTTAWQWLIAQGGNDKYYSVADPMWIALSTDNTGASATHSSWQTFDGSYGGNIEITTGGLGRVAVPTAGFTQAVAYTPGGTPLPTDQGSYTYSISRTFTVATGFSFTGVQKAGLFTGTYNVNDGSTSALAITPLVAENTFEPVTLSAGDSIAITWRITL